MGYKTGGNPIKSGHCVTDGLSNRHCVKTRDSRQPAILVSSRQNAELLLATTRSGSVAKTTETRQTYSSLNLSPSRIRVNTPT